MPVAHGEVQECIDALATELRRPIVLVDRRGGVLAYSRHTGAIDRLRSEVILTRQVPDSVPPGGQWLSEKSAPRHAMARVRVPADVDLGLHARVIVRVRRDDETLGLLSVLDADASLSDAMLDAAQPRVDHLARLLDGDHGAGGSAVDRDRDAVRDLLSAAAPQRAAAAENLSERRRFDRDCAVAALVLVPTTSAATVAERRAVVEQCLVSVRRACRPRRALHLTRADHGVLLLGVDGIDDGSAREAKLLAQRLVVAATKRLPADTSAPRALVGVGGIQPRLEMVTTSYTQARHAVTVAQVTQEHVPIASWDRLGVFRLLVDLPQRDFETAAPRALRRLGGADDGTLIATLECYLDHAGHAQATANALCLHRATLYYRLDRIKRIAGVDLSDGGQRLELHIWLKLLRLRGSGTFTATRRGDPDLMPPQLPGAQQVSA